MTRLTTDRTHRCVRRQASSEQGTSLLETAVSVFLLGTVVVTVVVLLLAVVRSTEINRKVVRGGNAAAEVAEVVERVPYQPCAPTSHYVSASGFGLDGYEAEVLRIDYLADSTQDVAEFVDACPSQDQGVQRITVRMRSVSGGQQVSQDLVFFRREDACPQQNLDFEGQQC